MEVYRYIPDLRSSGLPWVALAFGLLGVLNALTLLPGREAAVSYVNANPLGPLVAVVVFDTPWTIAGLLGLVVLFSPVLFGAPVKERHGLSLFFVAASVLVGVIASLIWDEFFDNAGVVGAGSSGVAIAGQGLVFGLALQGLFRLYRQDTRSLGRMSSYWWYAFGVVYATLVLTTVWFVAFLQPIFTPTQAYNWRVHELAFLIAVGASFTYGAVTWSRQGFDGKVRVDESLVNFHYDDLNDRFPQRLPKLHVVFSGVASLENGDFDPGRGELRLPPSLKGLDYFQNRRKVDDALLHAMIHAELFCSRRPWEHGSSEARAGFDELARMVGASPEP